MRRLFLEAIAKIRRKAASRRKTDRVGRKEPGEEYQVMAENAAQGIIVLQDGRLRYANARVRGFLKEPIEELTPEVLVNMVHPDDRPMVWGRYAQRLRGEEVPKVYSFRTVAADGRVLWLEFSVSLIEWEGRPATLVLAENITERKKMEAELAESEKTIRALLDASPAMEFLVGSEGKILVYNQAFERFFGRDGKPLTGRNIQDLLSPEEIQVNRGKALEVLSTGKPVFFEDYQRGLWLGKSFSPILDEEGRVAKIACYGMDISEKKRATEALKENELRYRLLAENVSDYIWSADRNLRRTYVSPGVTRLLGYTPEELMAQKLEDQLTPDSVALVRKVYAQEMAKEKKGSKEQPQPQILVMEYRRKDGSTFWAETRVRPVFDSEGNVASLVGITHDISDRKKAEEELRESERRYRLLADNATDFIWTMDWNLRLTYVSPGVTRLRGYTPEEVMAEPLEEAFTPDSWALIQKVYAEELAEEQKATKDLSRTLELEYRRKDGSTVWAESRISAIRDREGRSVEILGVTRDISERKKAEQALRESEKTVRALLDGIPAAEILVDTRGTILATNQTFDHIYGRDGKPLVGRNISELIPPQENEVNLAKGSEVLRTGQPVIFEDRQRGIWIEKGFYPILDENGQVTKIACYGRDISEWKRAEEARRESEKRYQLLADNLTDAIWTMDLNLRLTYVSPGLARLRGYRVEETMAQTLEEMLTPDSCAYARKVFAEEMAEEMKESKDLSRSRPLELEYRCRDDSTLWAESKVTAVRDEKGQITGILGVSRNITERKKAEQELAQYQAHLEEMVRERTARIQELEQQRTGIEKMAATGVLAARIAHEINNPLAGIKGAFMLIKDAVPLEHQYHHYIDRIQKEINRIARIVRQMFELYRPPDEDQEEWTLDQMIQDVTSLLKDECRERGVSIQFDLPPLKVRLPAGPVRQVLFNTIKNAVEASPLQGVVHIAVEKKQEKIVIRVRDQGPGISEEIRPHIFEPFYTTKRGKRGGLGLGLSISKDIVESLGGSIHFQNQSGRGVLCRIVFSHKKRKKDPKDG